MTKVVISQNNGNPPFWHVVNFLGPGKSESRGIVDLIAIRKNQNEHERPLKRGDLFDIVLIQVKGGSARWPTDTDRERLRKVGEEYHAKAILLSEWKAGTMPVIYRLTGDDWESVKAADVFGGPRRKVSVKPQDARTLAKKSSVALTAEGPGLLAEAMAPSAKSIGAKKAWATRRAAKAAAAKA